MGLKADHEGAWDRRVTTLTGFPMILQLCFNYAKKSALIEQADFLEIR